MSESPNLCGLEKPEWVSHGVHADPIAAHAWARQATALGWPEGVLEPGDAVGSHQQEPGGRP